ncbi:CHAT domain-containing protein [Kordia jejudonensis]|uniref:CHAT domain-containing protein n=1 Tax=Kordia jejudonensis TaxID=1348245 RepID=UPI0012E0457E|nr:CHAT domain-containing protein [Kordia jejudonensis]
MSAKNCNKQEATKQDSITKPSISFLWKKSNALKNTEQYDELLAFLEKHLKSVQPQNEKDSLDVADMYYNQYEGNIGIGKNLESINSANKGIPYCGDATSKRAKHIKGVLYYKRAYGESNVNFAKRAQLSMKTAIEYLTEDYNLNLDYLVDAHVFLSSQAAYHGNLAKAKRSLRFAENIYTKHKQYLDTTKSHRYEPILAYRKIYLLYQLAKKKEDSIELIKTAQKLEDIHASKAFQENERIYYSTGLNHIGDWYLSHKEDSLTTPEDIEIGSYYIDKSIDLVVNKNYSGNYFSFKYNKCKALTKSNKLEEANTLMLHLLDSMAPNDRRISFFLAQKALIKAKLGQKDSALHTFHAVIAQVHSDTIPLAKDYSNFKPSKVYGESRLIRRVAEKLTLFYNDDPNVQKTIATLYDLAFIQFENSYARTKFNPAQNLLLRKIIYGKLATTNNDTTNNISTSELLSQTETMMNQMTWQRFYQNRYTNKLPALDSLRYRHLKLRTLLTTAKRDNNIREEDSLLYLINQHEDFTREKFPNLELLSSKEFDINSLQQNLADDELVIKYMLFEQKLAIFSITSNHISYELLPWTTQQIDLVSTYVDAIKNRTYTTEKTKLLKEFLLPEITENIKKIIINPDGELYKIPFETIQINNQFLAETYEIGYTSNLKFIHLDNITNATNETTLAIYAPTYEGENLEIVTRSGTSRLEGAKAEAKTIGKLFPSKIYIGKEVSKKYFLETAPEANILHLAMHAEVNNEEAGLSRLLFSDTNTDKDDLYLEELYALQLDADLAVLSACNTGLGKENAGRSMESFQRAFTFAGVPATVASLWEVPDQSTSEIMKSFYTYLKKGTSKSEALQHAKLDYINNHKGSKLVQPYYWAGFILYGNQTAVTTSTSNTIWYVLGIGVALLLFLFVRKKLKKY